jgi:gluconokinase
MGRVMQNRSVVVMGVSGCGKTTVGAALALRLGWEFVEGDAFHSDGNRRKMHAGIALTDADRQAWLAQLGQTLSEAVRQPVVLSCSALKRSYRDRFRHDAPGLHFVWLDVTRDLAAERVASREVSHFFPRTLIDSQFETLEAPCNEKDVLRVDGGAPLSSTVDQACAWLRERANP